MKHVICTLESNYKDMLSMINDAMEVPQQSISAENLFKINEAVIIKDRIYDKVPNDTGYRRAIVQVKL